MCEGETVHWQPSYHYSSPHYVWSYNWRETLNRGNESRAVDSQKLFCLLQMIYVPRSRNVAKNAKSLNLSVSLVHGILDQSHLEEGSCPCEVVEPPATRLCCRAVHTCHMTVM